MPLFDAPIGNASPVMPVLGSPYRMPPKDWIRSRQPYLDSRGRPCVTIQDLNGGWTVNDSHGGERKPILRSYLVADLFMRGYPINPVVANATSMRKGDWIEMDKAIVRAARQELRAWDDLKNASSYGGFNAMGKMTLEYEAMNDPGFAVVDMDAATDGNTNDRPQFLIRSLPLPITHSDFGTTQRMLMVSQNSDTPFDTVMAEAGARRVVETVEDTTIGLVTGTTYGTQTLGYPTHTGTSTVYGYTNFPQRLTKTNFTSPLSATPETTYNEVLAAIQQLLVQYFRGPFILYHSLDWNQYMQKQFSVAGGNNAGETLRSMLLKIPQIQDVRLLERLTSTFTFIFVQMTPEVAQAVVGMDITTVQWELKGGLELRWKVMCILVPRLRSDYNSRTGILHGTTA